MKTKLRKGAFINAKIVVTSAKKINLTIPREYIKIILLLILEICFRRAKRTYLDIMFKDFKLRIEWDLIERYNASAIIETKSYKDLMEKEIKYKNHSFSQKSYQEKRI